MARRTLRRTREYPFDFVLKNGILEIDPRPVIAAVARDIQQNVEAAIIARRFHNGIAEMIAQVCCRLRKITGIDLVVLSGGVFLNALLTCRSVARLRQRGFRVYRHRRVPPGDGGLSLGQLAVAAACLAGDSACASACPERSSKPTANTTC